MKEDIRGHQRSSEVTRPTFCALTVANSANQCQSSAHQWSSLAISGRELLSAAIWPLPLIRVLIRYLRGISEFDGAIARTKLRMVIVSPHRRRASRANRTLHSLLSW